LIRACNHSSFCKVGDHPLDQQVRRAANRRRRGAATDADVQVAIDEMTTLVVALQGRAFIEIVTDGMIGWCGPLSHLVRGLDGLRTAELYRWFDTNFHERRLQVIGEISRREPFLVHDFEVAKFVAVDQLVKVGVPGPVTAARMARDEHYGGIEPLADALASVLAEEVAALVEAGARCFQVDEPLLCRHPEDLELVARTSGRIFEAAGADATTVLSTYYGDLAALADRLGELPGTHIGLDMVSGDGNYDLLSKLPDGRGVALGLFDARTSRQEDADDVAGRLEPHRETLCGRDVLVGPNAGLELLPQDQGFDKLLHARYVVEKLSQEWTWDS